MSGLSDAEWNAVCRLSGEHTEDDCDAMKALVEQIVAARVTAALTEAAERVRSAWVAGWSDGHAIGWEHCQDGNYGTDYWDDRTPVPALADTYPGLLTPIDPVTSSSAIAPG